MRNFNKTLIACAAGFSLTVAGAVQAFSFGSDDHYYPPPYWVSPYAFNPYMVKPYGANPNAVKPGAKAPAEEPPAESTSAAAAPAAGGPYAGPVFVPLYRPWGWGPGAYGIPWLNRYDRSTITHRRQRTMSEHDKAMNELRDMMYTDQGFDRTRAVQIVRKIEATSGESLISNFHPGSIRSMGSHTTLALLGNQETFKAHAKALQAAAADLAEELAKSPTAEEGAIYLTKGPAYGREAPEQVAVSPEIWKKFNALSDTCVNCHHNFRGRGWW